jgi:RNA-directed DNA polymerase
MGVSARLRLPPLEDKIAQRAAVAVLNAIYEEDFLGFSYGFPVKEYANLPGAA